MPPLVLPAYFARAPFFSQPSSQPLFVSACSLSPAGIPAHQRPSAVASRAPLPRSLTCGGHLSPPLRSHRAGPEYPSAPPPPSIFRTAALRSSRSRPVAPSQGEEAAGVARWSPRAVYRPHTLTGARRREPSAPPSCAPSPSHTRRPRHPRRVRRGPRFALVQALVLTEPPRSGFACAGEVRAVARALPLVLSRCPSLDLDRTAQIDPGARSTRRVSVNTELC
jgi:hypothetical protein